MTRSNRNLSYNGTQTYTAVNDGWGNSSPSLSWLAPRFKQVETYSGVSRRKPAGWKNPTPYSAEMDAVNCVTGDMTYGQHTPNTGTPEDVVFRQSGCLEGGTAIGSSSGYFSECLQQIDWPSGPGVANDSLITALGNLKNSKINLGVAWAERSLTARLIGDTAKTLAKSYTHVLRGQTRKAMRSLGVPNSKSAPVSRNAAGRWLELQYGWKPLLSDVYGGAEALATRERHDWRVTAKGHKVSKVSSSINRSKANGLVWPGPRYQVSAQVEVKAFTRIDAIPVNEALISLSSLGITNPALIVWERVPFSFVVDWILPIGNWLNAMDALLGYQDIWSSTSVKTAADYSFSGSSEFYPNEKFVYASLTGSRRYRKLVRSVDSGLIIPRMPRIKDPKSLTHMANGLALLTQVFRR